MTTTVSPEPRPDLPEREERPTLDQEPANTTRQQADARSFDPTQGRKIGSDPYDEPTQGRKIGSDPYDDPTQGGKIGADPYDGPTRVR